MEEKLLSVNDICEYLCIGRDTIYKWIAAKSLPAYRLGRHWKFKKKEDDDFFIDFHLKGSRRLSSTALLRARNSSTMASPLSTLYLKASNSCKIKVLNLK